MRTLLSSPFFFAGFALWQVVVVATPISLYGFWTDALVFVLWLAYLMSKAGRSQRWMRAVSAMAFVSLIGLGLLAISTLVGAFMLVEVAMTRYVPQEEKLQGIFLVNQYYRPTGAYGCGMGSITTAKALVFFPFVEYRTEHDPCTHENWGCRIERGTWEGCY